MKDEPRLVWRSGAGRVRYCNRCGAPEDRCTCRTTPSRPPVARDGSLLVGRSSKGHAGKTVTTISGAPGSPEELRALLQTLKRQCGAGGTVQPDGVILMQGDMRERVESILREMGFKTKRVGG